MRVPVASNGLQLGIRTWPGEGPTVLFLHGLARTGADWASLAQAIGHPWRRLAVDLRGHGSSDRAEEYCVRHYAHDLEQVLPLLSAQPVMVMGHSLGALVAMALAARCPDRVAGIILEDPPTPGFVQQIAGTGYAQMFEAYGHLAGSGLTVAEVAARLAALPIRDPLGATRLLGEMRDQPSLRFMASCLVSLDPRAPLAALAGLGWLDGYDVESLLASIHCPVLLLRGDERFGGMMPLEETNRLFAGVRDLTRLDMKGVGHQIHGVALEPTVRAVTSFVHSVWPEC